jgi:vancomycin permeability regulator SanA
MKNNQKTISSTAKVNIYVALKATIKHEHNLLKNAQKFGMTDNSNYWRNRIKANIAAYREIESI